MKEAGVSSDGWQEQIVVVVQAGAGAWAEAGRASCRRQRSPMAPQRTDCAPPSSGVAATDFVHWYDMPVGRGRSIGKIGLG